ncbi:Peroxisome biogenesis factor 10 [Acorus calamus]|uniref:Peroxisome biogenesis factor 10 n=1 Tax=Acorus calamus TaxID=4465 RepID=A0AAV9DRG6_ACOCL|nr:Peroxisome biogenesis factor 10 [Acorus calamus]
MKPPSPSASMKPLSLSALIKPSNIHRRSKGGKHWPPVDLILPLQNSLDSLRYYTLTSSELEISRRIATPVLPFAREMLQLVLRTNLMFFYFEDVYCGSILSYIKACCRNSLCFYWETIESKAEIPDSGCFPLDPMCIIAAEELRRSNLSSISSVHHIAFHSQ